MGLVVLLRNLTKYPEFLAFHCVCTLAVVLNMEERERSVKSDSREMESAPGGSSTSAPELDLEAGSKDDAGPTNVCSDRFDPLLALYSSTVQLPFPNIKCFNNVAEYESFLKGGRGRAKPENVEKRQRKAMKGVVDLERIERLKKLMVNNPVSESEGGEGGSGTTRRKRRQKPVKNVLTRMPRRSNTHHYMCWRPAPTWKAALRLEQYVFLY